MYSLMNRIGLDQEFWNYVKWKDKSISWKRRQIKGDEKS